jgi:hypothetical protein
MQPIGFASFVAPNQAVSLLRDGRAALEQGRADDAEKLLLGALDADPELIPAHRALADALATRGDRAGATREIGAVVAGDLRGAQTWLANDHTLDALMSDGPTRATIKAEEAAALATYTEGLAPGGDSILMVARNETQPQGQSTTANRPEGRPEGRDEELYAYQPSAGRYRRLSDTDGQLLGWIRTPGEAAVLLLVCSRSRAGAEGPVIVDPGVIRLDLTTLDQVGPLPLPSAAEVSLTFDQAGDALAVVPSSPPALLDFGALRLRPAPSGPASSADTLLGWIGGARLTRSTASNRPGAVTTVLGRAVDPSTRQTSPGGWTAVAEPVTSCTITAGGSAAVGEVMVGAPTGDARDIATVRDAIDLAWSGDDTLVYADGLARNAAVHVVDLSLGTTRPLGGRLGAGLHGIIDQPDCRR